MRKRSYLAEGLFDIQVDVEWLYEQSGLSRLDKIFTDDRPAKEIIETLRWASSKKSFFRTNSSKLKSYAAKQAHEANPILISFGTSKARSFYKPPQNGKRGTMAVNINRNVFDSMKMLLRRWKDGDPDPKVVMGVRWGSRFETIAREFDATTIKGTIAHELNHWLSDTMHNFYITNSIGKYSKMTYGERMAHDATETQSQHELEAQVQSIQTLKDVVGEDVYKKFDWVDLFKHRLSLNSNFKVFSKYAIKILDDADFDNMMKRLARRLHREGLLTRKMRKLPSRAQFAKFEQNI
jgi:hypothetical protein